MPHLHKISQLYSVSRGTKGGITALLQHGRSRLLDLPVEIVLHIIDLLHEDRDDIPLYFQPIWSLSLVNRAFYIAAMPVRYSRVVLLTVGRLCRFVDFIESSHDMLDPGQRPFEQLVCHLRIGSFRRAGVMLDAPRVQWKWSIPMKRLQSFQCFIATDAEQLCRVVRLFPQLTSLMTLWPHAADLRLLLSCTSARQIRVFLYAADSIPETSLPRPDVGIVPVVRAIGENPFVALTHISIAANGLSSARLQHLCYLTLPGLQAFHLDHTRLSPQDVFTFVARHEKLSAVTIYFDTRYVLLSAIIELMYGEFGSIGKDARHELDVEPEGDNLRSLYGDLDPYPASESIACVGFAFERKFYGQSKLYETYAVTALGLAIANSQDAWSGLSLGYPRMRDLFAALSEEKRLQWSVRELSVMANCGTDCVRVSTVWRYFANEMSQWRRLAHIRLWWPLEQSSFSWALLRNSDSHSVLQNTGPPLTSSNLYPGPAWGVPMTLSDVQKEDKTCLSPTIRILDRLNLNVDYLDRGLLMEAWRLLRERELQFAMQEIAERLPALEQIIWYPQYEPLQATTVAWDWRLHESHVSEIGSVEYLTNRLHWTTDLNEVPCPPCIAVGGEYAEILRLRRCL